MDRGQPPRPDSIRFRWRMDEPEKAHCVASLSNPPVSDRPLSPWHATCARCAPAPVHNAPHPSDIPRETTHGRCHPLVQPRSLYRRCQFHQSCESFPGQSLLPLHDGRFVRLQVHLPSRAFNWQRFGTISSNLANRFHGQRCRDRRLVSLCTVVHDHGIPAMISAQQHALAPLIHVQESSTFVLYSPVESCHTTQRIEAGFEPPQRQPGDAINASIGPRVDGCSRVWRRGLRISQGYRVPSRWCRGFGGRSAAPPFRSRNHFRLSQPEPRPEHVA
jgi:hypothetical protein